MLKTVFQGYEIKYFKEQICKIQKGLDNKKNIEAKMRTKVQ